MEIFDGVISLLENVKNNPEQLFNKEETKLEGNTMHLLRESFNLFSRSKGFYKVTRNKKKSLTELYTDGFHDEQIWQQIELKNDIFLSYIPFISDFLLSKSEVTFPCLENNDRCEETNDTVPKNDDSVNGEEDAKEEVESSSDESDSDDNEDPNESTLSLPNKNLEDKKSTRKKDKPVKKKTKSVVDDEFFNLQEMEDFLDKAENGNLPEDDIDYFTDISSDAESEEKELKYDDFFRNPENDNEEIEANSANKRKLNEEEDENESSGEEDENESVNEDDEVHKNKKVRFSLHDDGDEEENSGPDENSTDEEKTSFEVRESKLKKKIEKLEEANLSEKPWPYKGEVYSSGRPVNSLLEEVLDVDLTLRPPPVITEQVTNTLEQIIMNRIKDSSYDDVERKIKPVHVPHELKKELVLNQEKSKFSLAEIYEKEYLKQKPTSEAKEDSNKLTPEKEMILKKMKILFHKLDSLSNFHYTPKPISADIEIVSNLPAITIEEVAPVAMSDANLLAPQEIGDAAKKKLLGKDERSKQDKRRERRKKKKFLSKKFKGAKKNENSTLAKTLKSRNVNLVVPNSDNNIKSSTKFFKKLQEDKEVVKKVKKK